jgi:hypothetical protein
VPMRHDTSQTGELVPRTRLFRLRGLHIAVIVAVVAASVTGLVRGGYTLLSGITDYQSLTRDSVYTVLSSATQWVLYGAGALFVVWLWRARKNLDALGSRSVATFGAGWAIGVWFLPIANLIIPYVLLAQVTRDSTSSKANVWLVRGWWMGVIGQLLGLAALLMDDWVPFFVAAAVLWVIAGGFLVAIVAIVTVGLRSKMDGRPI